MYVVVGLGNPGAKYARTHHNAGFDVLEIVAAQLRIPLIKAKCKARLGEGVMGSERVVLAQPQTYMNLSGECVVQLLNWYKVDMEHLIIVYDDVDLPLGAVRVRAKGSAGTHNGMRSIIELLGRDDFPRVRVGIGRPPEKWDLADYVLSSYETPEQRQIAFEAYQKAATALLMIVKEGVPKAAAFANTIKPQIQEEQ